MEDYLKVILEVLKESSEILYVKDEEKEAEFSETRKIAEELAYNIGASLKIEDDDLFIGAEVLNLCVTNSTSIGRTCCSC